MEKDIYINTILKKQVILKPEYINRNFEKNIENLLKSEVGDKCIKEGYVKSDSINIIKRSTSKIISSNFSGDVAINIVYSANVCNPVRGNIIECTIKNINKLGLQAENFPLSIIVAKQYHNNKDIFKNLKVGQKVEISVIGKRYSLNDKIIEIVGKLTTDKDNETNKFINIKTKTNKQKETTNVFQSSEPKKLQEDTESIGELESIVEESEEEEVETEEEQDVYSMDEDIKTEEDEEDEEDDMLEQEIEEEEDIEEETEDFE